MPGILLTIRCPCGLKGGASVGVTLPEYRGGPFIKYVAAYDPETGKIIHIEEEEAKARELIFYDGVSEQDHHCPKCGQDKLEIGAIGHWD